MQAVGTGAGSVCVCMRCSGDGGAATAVFFLNWCFEHFSGLPHLFPPPLPPFLSLPQTNLSISPFLKIKSLLMEPEDWLPLGIIYCHLLVFSNETCRRFFSFLFFYIYIIFFFL